MNINKKQYNQSKFGYAFYDFANSGYVLLFQSFLFPLFLSSFYSNATDSAEIWGYVLFASNLIAILAAPIIGRIADLKNRIKIFSVLIIIVAILAFFSVLSANIALILVLFIIFNSSFELSQSLYDSFLNVISKNKDEKIEISTFSWGFGYVGGILFVITYFVLDKLKVDTKYILAVASILYLLFSYISVYLLKKVSNNHENLETESKKNILALKVPKEIVFSLVIYFIVFVATTAVINFSSIYFNKELQIEQKTIGAIMLAGQLLAFPLTILSGRVAKRLGIVNTIKICLIIWCLGLFAMAFSKTVTHIGIVVFIFSFVIGSTQSLIRAHFSNVVENINISENYGYYGISNKAGSLLSPLLVSTSISLTGSIRYVFFVIIAIIIIGLLMTNKLEKK